MICLVSPLVSIIVPALNEAAGVGPALKQFASLRASGEVEVILVDGGSRDGTVNIARQLVDQFVQAEPGRARQMNAGAALARGKFLLFLHADTLLPGNWLDEVALARLQGRVWGRFDVRLSGGAWQLRLVETLMNLRSRWSGIATGDQAIFVSGSVFRETGGFPEKPLMEDLDLSARLLRQGRPYCSRQKVLTSSRRWEEEGILRTILLMWRLRFLYWLGVPAEKLVRSYYPRR